MRPIVQPIDPRVGALTIAASRMSRDIRIQKNQDG
jgi:hypothetical protein